MDKEEEGGVFSSNQKQEQAFLECGSGWWAINGTERHLSLEN